HLLEPRLHLLRVGDIHLNGKRFPACRSNLAYQRGKLFFIPRCDSDLCARFRQRQRRIAANSLRRPRHQRHFVLQTEHLLCALRALYVIRAFSYAASAFAAAIFSSVVAKLFSSSIFKAATDRSICRSKPVSTRCGPTSTNVFTPSSIISCTDSSQRTGIETCRISAFRASSPFSIVSASTFVTSGTRKFENSTLSKSLASFSCAGIISAEWNGAETGKITARFAPSCDAISVARFTAPA